MVPDARRIMWGVPTWILMTGGVALALFGLGEMIPDPQKGGGMVLGGFVAVTVGFLMLPKSVK